MKGFKSVEELSLKSCYNFLSSEENREHTLYPAIAERYQEMLQDLEKQDASDYAACKTIDNYNAYIKKFSDNSIAPYYKAKHIFEANNAIEDLFWNTHKKSVGGCKEYLSRYPKGKYANIANNRIGSSKKTKWLVLGIVLIVLVITFFIGYKPVNSLSVSESSLSFGKWGGPESVSVSTNVSSNAVDMHCLGSGFSIDGGYGHEFKVSAEPNEGDIRTGNVKVTAYATLYGMRIGSGESASIILSQESGLASYLHVSQTSISVAKQGASYQITVNTDGVKLEASSKEEWINISKESDGRYNITVQKNAGDSRQGAIEFASGSLRREVSVSQVSGLASFLSLSRSSISNVEKSGTESGRCYRVNVSTDGVSWDIYSSPGWVNITKYDNFFEITVDYNSGDVRNGTICVHSNNDHSESISISQDGNPSSFYASRSSLTFDTDRDYEYVSVMNNSNQSVSASTDRSWLSASISGGSLKISCSNNSDSPRDGIVTLHCGDKSTRISVRQKGWRYCNSCNNGYKSCPNGMNSWSSWGGSHSYFYQYENGRHVLKHVYTAVGPYGMPVPASETTICDKCNGSGSIRCSNCHGKGKYKVN